MDVSAPTIDTYLGVAFAGMDRVLDRLNDITVNQRPPGWGTNTVAGLIVHCCELAPSWFATPGLGRATDRDRESEFTTKATIGELRERIAHAADTAASLAAEFATTERTARDHPLREFLPGNDRSDAALLLHVFEELFQHLGHMEVTADALDSAQPSA